MDEMRLQELVEEMDQSGADFHGDDCGCDECEEERQIDADTLHELWSYR